METTTLAPPPLALPENARAFTVKTSRRTAQVIATSVEEATAIFACQRFPLHVPPAPMPGMEKYRDENGWLRDGPTAANQAWFDAYRDDLWGRLDHSSGECMINVYETPADS